jgi:competence protein CoiA
MLVAEVDSQRIEAAEAAKGGMFLCPNCKQPLILKQGRIVIAHFAHKPPTYCTWSQGETRAHLEAKHHIRDVLVSRGTKAEVEVVVPILPGNDRRADVMAWSKNGQSLAFELQHSSIGIDEIERRAFAYARAGIAQIWIPFLRDSIWKDGELQSNGSWYVERYSPRPFEKWIHGLNLKFGMWKRTLWKGKLEGHQIYKEVSSWFDSDGQEHYGGGNFYWSKKFRCLTLGSGAIKWIPNSRLS